MKKFTSIILFTLIAFSASSQIEIKINPFTLLFSSFDVSLEYGINENIGVDIAPSFNFGKTTYLGEDGTNSHIGIVVNPRYYFNPNRGIDKFYFGVYGKLSTGKSTYSDDTYIKRTRFAIGPNLGYKVSSNSGFIFDIGFGIGKALVNDWDSDIIDFDDSFLDFLTIDFIGTLAVGWRF